MSQEIIRTFLEQHLNRYNAAQIVYHLSGKLSPSVIYANLAKLRNKGEISFVWSDYLSRNGRPIRLYYSKELKEPVKKEVIRDTKLVFVTEQDYFNETEFLLRDLLVQIKKIKEYLFGLKHKKSFESYEKKGLILSLWNECKKLMEEIKQNGRK